MLNVLLTFAEIVPDIEFSPYTGDICRMQKNVSLAEEKDADVVGALGL